MPDLTFTHDPATTTTTFHASRHAYRLEGKGRQRSLTLIFDDTVQAVDRLDIGSQKARDAFAGRFNGRSTTIAQELMALAAGAEQATSDGDESTNESRPSQATLLVNLATAAGVDLFHDHNGEAYASFMVGGHRETVAIKAKAFRSWLARGYFEQYGGAPGSQALQDAQTVLSGQALYQGAQVEVWTRLAEHEDRLYVDLGDDAWQVIEIGPDGWRVLPSAEAPVKFRRSRSMLALPLPDPAGTLDDLGLLVNVRDDDDLVLIKGWLVGTLCSKGGRAILELTGEQGSCKTTTARILKRIIDPSGVPLRTTPRDERDLVIAASNGLIVAFDNLSEPKDWFSDALCRLSTGGGIGGRELYTDTDEVVLDAQRPCLLTGINTVATRSDLGDRTLSVTLPAVPAEQRRTEADLWADFDALHACLLGGVLNAVVAALANRDVINLPRKPRLADFVAWVEGASPALRWAPGDFLSAFEASRRNVDAVTIEALAIGPTLLRFMQDRDEWEGTASQLLEQLTALIDDATKRDRDWPKRANRLSNQLRRLSPNLRQVGLWVGLDRSGAAGTRTITLTKNSPVWDRQYRLDRQSPSENPRRDAENPPKPPDDGDRQSSSVPLAWDDLPDDADGPDDGFAESSKGGMSSVECSFCGAPLPDDRSYACRACRPDPTD